MKNVSRLRYWRLSAQEAWSWVLFAALLIKLRARGLKLDADGEVVTRR